jgi:hypothetical protein
MRRDINPETTGWATEVLEQERLEAGTWNLSTGGVGLILKSHLDPGMRLVIELYHPRRGEALVAWAEVRHTICCPSFDEMWVTGCSFLDPVEGQKLRPFV